MDIYALDTLDNFSAYESNRKEPVGYDETGREFKELTNNANSHIPFKPLMGRRADEMEVEAGAYWDEQRGARVEAKVTWKWESKDDSIEPSSETKKDPDTSCRDADSKDKP